MVWSMRTCLAAAAPRQQMKSNGRCMSYAELCSITSRFRLPCVPFRPTLGLIASVLLPLAASELEAIFWAVCGRICADKACGGPRNSSAPSHIQRASKASTVYECLKAAALEAQSARDRK